MLTAISTWPGIDLAISYITLSNLPETTPCWNINNWHMFLSLFKSSGLAQSRYMYMYLCIYVDPNNLYLSISLSLLFFVSPSFITYTHFLWKKQTFFNDIYKSQIFLTDFDKIVVHHWNDTIRSCMIDKLSMNSAYRCCPCLY